MEMKQAVLFAKKLSSANIVFWSVQIIFFWSEAG